MTTPSDPVRTCVGCRALRSQADLVRVARRPDGGLVISRTLAGRGAWLCAGSSDCVQQAARRNAFSRAFRTPVSPDETLALSEDLGG